MMPSVGVILSVLAVVCSLSGCTSTVRRIGSDAVAGGVAYTESPAGAAKLDAIGDRIGEAAGRGAARGARAEAATVPWWTWAAMVLLAVVPLAGAWWAVRALTGWLGREFTTRGFHRALDTRKPLG